MGIDPERKATVLWGVIGGLSFLVLVQGYELVVGTRIEWATKAGIALAVAVVAAALVHLARPRLARNERA